MPDFVLSRVKGAVGIVTLNRPEILNAWHTRMRAELIQCLTAYEDNEAVRAIILTGAGDRAFCAGQDLNETKSFSADDAVTWIDDFERLYDCIRSLTKPLVVALNGVAAGSGFQVALLGDFRIAHAGVKMGQPEIDAGIASVTGPWIMREMIGLARTIDLTLSGRLMEADESYRIGLLSKIVDADRLMPEAFALADSLAEKAPVAMRLNKQRFREVTEPGFRDSFEAAMRIHHRSYETGEPARMMGRFLDKSRAKGH